MTNSTPTNDITTAMLLIERLGVSVDDLRVASSTPRHVPTFGEYHPIVYDAMPDTVTRDMYRNYWRKLWPDKRLDEPTVTELKQLIEST